MRTLIGLGMAVLLATVAVADDAELIRLRAEKMLLERKVARLEAAAAKGKRPAKCATKCKAAVGVSGNAAPSADNLWGLYPYKVGNTGKFYCATFIKILGPTKSIIKPIRVRRIRSKNDKSKTAPALILQGDSTMGLSPPVTVGVGGTRLQLKIIGREAYKGKSYFVVERIKVKKAG